MLLPGNMALGATRSPTLAYVAGQALSIDLKLLGFNMNLAPVLDVNSNPKNPVALGDIATNLIWDSGKTNVFAIAGDFDLNNDGVADYDAVEKITALIEKLHLRDIDYICQAHRH